MVSMNLEYATDKERQLMVSIAKTQRSSARSCLMEGKVQNMFWYEGEGARLKASNMSNMSSSGAYNKEKGHYLFLSNEDITMNKIDEYANTCKMKQSRMNRKIIQNGFVYDERQQGMEGLV